MVVCTTSDVETKWRLYYWPQLGTRSRPQTWWGRKDDPGGPGPCLLGLLLREKGGWGPFGDRPLGQRFCPSGPSRAGAASVGEAILMAPQGPCHWRKRSLEPCHVSLLDHLLPLGMVELLCWLVSPAPHPHPLPSACGLGKAQAQSPLPHPVHRQPGRALCLLPPGALHALCQPGMHAAPRKAGCSPNPG